MKTNVREIIAKDNDGNAKTLFVYKGFFCVKGGSVGFHTPRLAIRNGAILANIPTDDVFTMANDKFNEAGEFQRVIDKHIEYINRAFGNLKAYFALN